MAFVDRQFLIGLSRAFAGALIFAIPLLMTMEMWWLGFYLEPWRMALFTAVLLPMLLGLSHFAGFRETRDWFEDAIDALVAYAVGFVCSACFLKLFGILGPGMGFRELLGKVALLSVPASIGAIVAQKQLGEEVSEALRKKAGYGGELFLMAGGALFLAFNVAPTEEMILIAYKMSRWHALALFAATLLIMHAVVYGVGFRGQEVRPAGRRLGSQFYRFTLVGYAIALLISLYVLWTFGRLDGSSLEMASMTMMVLGFPAGLGAAFSRLLV